jgi:hypothetical protein
MNKSFKSVLNRSTGTYVAASENVKSSGKSAKNKLAMKVASASLALGASIAMLSSGDVLADDSTPTNTYQVGTPDPALSGSDESGVVQANDVQDSSGPVQGAQQMPVGGQMLGAQQMPVGGQMLGAQQMPVGGQMLGAQQQLLGASPTIDPTPYVTMASLDHVLWSRSGTYGDAAPAFAAGFATTDSIAIGGGTLVTGTGNTIVGVQASSNGTNQNLTNATAIGFRATAGNASAALGYQSFADYNAVALGMNATASGLMSVSVGGNAGATGSGFKSVAIGNSANATAASAVALGAASLADRDNTVSVGASGSERQIVNVAAGTQATDVVNFAQLQATGLKVDTNGNATNSFVAYDDTTASTVTLGGTTGTKITNVAAGDVSSATSTDAVNGSQLYATNQNVAANTTAIAANTADIATNAAAISTNTTDISTLNTQAANAVKYASAAHNSITLDGTAGTKITNVAAGTLSATSTDAVNGAQLFHVTDGTSVINSAYVKVGGANNGTDNAVLSGSGVAIGASAKADTDTVAVGGNAVATSNGMYGSMAIGTSANGGAGGTAIGYHTLSTGISSVALGKGATAGGGIQQLWAPGPRQADTTRWRSGRLRSPQGIIP